MRFFTSIHLVLLAYIIAALVYWEIVLQKQSGQIYQKDLTILKSRVDSTNNPVGYTKELKELNHVRVVRTNQFADEGATFLIVILIGAVVVYTSFRRRIMVSRQ